MFSKNTFFNPQTPTAAQSRGSLLVKRQNESIGCAFSGTDPGFRVWGSSWRKEFFCLISFLSFLPSQALQK